MATKIEMGFVNSSGTLTTVYPKTDASNVVFGSTTVSNQLTSLGNGLTSISNAISTINSSIDSIKNKTSRIEFDGLSLKSTTGSNPSSGVYLCNITISTSEYIGDYKNGPLFLSVVLVSPAPASAGYSTAALYISGVVGRTSIEPQFARSNGIAISKVTWYIDSNYDTVITLQSSSSNMQTYGGTAYGKLLHSLIIVQGD